MKNILLLLSTITVLQVSTCGNQGYSSYEKSGRGSTIIEDLYKQYRNANDNIEAIDEQYHDVLNDKSETLNDWHRYNNFSKSYWREAKLYTSKFDTSLQQSLMTYFEAQEKKYNSQTKVYVNETDKIQEQTADITNNMALLKLLASHKQMEEYLAKNTPEIKRIQEYNKQLEKTNTDVNKTVKDLSKGKPIVISQ